MNRLEVGTLIAYLAEAYPAAAITSVEHRINVWEDLLAPYDPDPVIAAARTWVRSGHKFPPGPADLLDGAATAAHGPMPSEADAWNWATSRHTRTDNAETHPVLRAVDEACGGVTTLSWLDENEMRRKVRSAYWGAVESYRDTVGRTSHPALTTGGTPIIDELPPIFHTMDDA